MTMIAPIVNSQVKSKLSLLKEKVEQSFESGLGLSYSLIRLAHFPSDYLQPFFARECY